MKFGKNKKNKKWIIYFILGGFIIKALAFIFNKKNQKKVQVNFKNFINDEKEEVEELFEGKEGIKKFCCDSGSIFKEYFIPHDGNDHKPKILRTKSLAIIVLGMFLIKAAVTGYLFFIYPNQARMTEIITKQILELINKDRISNNMPVLSINPVLSEAALAKARDMLDYDYFAHKSLDGRMPWDWIDRGEYAYLFVGENLAMNFSSAAAAHNALMQSETHKNNILNNKYADIGLAILPGELNGKQTNVLVQMFGYQRPQLAMAVQEEEEPAIQKPAVNLPINESAKAEEAPEQIATEAKPAIEKKIAIKPKQTEVAAVSASISKNMYTSPNPDIENNKIIQVMSFTAEEDEKITMAAKMLQISHYIFIAVLALVAIALLINIFVRISIQHKSVIAQSLLVIVFIASLVYVKAHFLEQILDKVAVL